MAAIGTSGKYFSSNEKVTAAKLHQIIESATITGFDQTNMASGSGLVISSATAPTDTDAIWYYSSLGIWLIYDSAIANWQPVGGMHVRLTNNSGGGVVLGDVVIFDATSNLGFTTTATDADKRFIGVAAETIANGASGIIQTCGKAEVNLLSGISGPLNYIKTSTTTKAATSSAYAVGVFGYCLDNPASAAGVFTCFLYGQASRG